MLFWNAAALAVGAAMDAALGDPRNMLHMVVVFGKVISFWEKILYNMKNKRVAGLLLVVLTLLCCGVPIALVLWLAWRIHPILYAAVGSFLCWQCLAARSLRDESDLVRVPLTEGDLPKAREMVGRIVGRDTDALDEAGVTRAAVETVAENTSDGVIAPIFYIALGGPLGGCLYKAANTMDSMVGYKNDRYIDFGRCAALFDDVVNYIPARLAALELVLAAYLTGMDGKNAWRIWKRDRRNHASPNSAQTESAVAGALGLRLAGDAVYFGKLHKKPYIGDDLRPIEPEDIRRSHRLMFAATGEMLVLALVFMLLIHFL